MIIKKGLSYINASLNTSKDYSRIMVEDVVKKLKEIEKKEKENIPDL